MGAQRLPWHAALWQRLEQARDEKRLAQAMLLAGAAGLGKQQFARQVTAWLMCEAPMKPCGECRGCRQVAAGTHPDALLLSEHGLHCLAADEARQDGAVPVWTPDRESKRQDIAVAGIRALIERFNLSSHYGQPRVAVIAPADALNPSGANMLLKTIEEPPPNTHLLLLAERWRYLPATLRSRCQMLRFTAPDRSEALAWLRKQHPRHDETELARFARRPLAAGQGLAADQAKKRSEWVAALGKVPTVAKGRWPILKTQGLKREDARFGLECWLETSVGWLRQRLAGDGSAGPAEFDARRLSNLCEALTEGLRRLERNVNPALVVESIIIRGAGLPAGEIDG